MGIAWPAGAPQFPETWNEANQPVTVRSSVDVGPPKVRRRYTSPLISIKTTFVGTHAQWLALLDFFNVDLQGGVLFHDFLDPFSGQVKEFRFVNPPTVNNISALGVQISCDWERFT